ncbi:MAG: hypothetical protein CMJ78_19090 [Planctomycetaceae bacterium]|nr:hypothetical protein [Planctomycetaceae bacterium]
MKTFKELTQFFQDEGADNVDHSTKGYLAHAIGVYNDLKKWGCDEELARVGLFHSIYGTEIFQNFTLDTSRRDDIRELIGDHAEMVCWMNCAIDRRHFDQEIHKESGPYQIRDRFTGNLVDVSDQEFHDLCLIHLCDWLEQVERSRAWDYRRSAYVQLAKRLGGVGAENFNRVFADAPECVSTDEYVWPETALN